MLVREKSGAQLSVYYVSNALSSAESRYTDMEKLTYFIMITSRKLRPYYQAYSIRRLTNLLLKQVLQKNLMPRRG